jgi:hypothetical protein
LNAVVAPKRLELLHELLPTATVMGLLIDPTDPANAETTTRDLQAASRSLGLKLHILNASTEPDFDPVFANLVQLRAGSCSAAVRFFTPAANSSPHWHCATRCRRSTKAARSSRPAA